jgi:hypothetical protein
MYRQFFLFRQSARKQQIDDIDASDEQYQSDCAKRQPYVQQIGLGFLSCSARATKVQNPLNSMRVESTNPFRKLLQAIKSYDFLPIHPKDASIHILSQTTY